MRGYIKRVREFYFEGRTCEAEELDFWGGRSKSSWLNMNAVAQDESR